MEAAESTDQKGLKEVGGSLSKVLIQLCTVLRCVLLYRAAVQCFSAVLLPHSAVLNTVQFRIRVNSVATEEL